MPSLCGLLYELVRARESQEWLSDIADLQLWSVLFSTPLHHCASLEDTLSDIKVH